MYCLNQVLERYLAKLYRSFPATSQASWIWTYGLLNESRLSPNPDITMKWKAIEEFLFMHFIDVLLFQVDFVNLTKLLWAHQFEKY